MLRELLHIITGRSVRDDDRTALQAGQDVAAPSLAEGLQKPAVLRRQTIQGLAVLAVAATIYGAFMPFTIDASRGLSWQLRWHAPATGDAVSNVLIYVLLGGLLRLVFRSRRSNRLSEWSFSLTAACALSYLTEVGQTIMPLRVASWTDAVCNFSGACIGIWLSPAMQRSLRNVHSWLYMCLRTRPMATAAATALLCLCTYALAPLDIRPSPSQLQRGLEHLQEIPRVCVWLPGVDPALRNVDILDKILSAGSYGLFAFLLLLSGREAGRSPGSAAGYALTRAAALATVVEALQLFTISHVADVRDLVSAWLCCGLGTLAGLRVVAWMPEVHRRPMTVLRGLLVAITSAVAAWAVGSMTLAASATGGAPAPRSWWPAIGSFHRTWNSLFADYVTGMLQYTLFAGLVVLWFRATRRTPRSGAILLGTLCVAMLTIVVMSFRQTPVDTAQLLLAVLGAVIALRADQAVFGRRTTVHAATER